MGSGAKMIYISHRGNLNGPKPELENHPTYIEEAIARGFDVEVDLWVNESGAFLGHDGPQYLVPHEWLIDRTDQIWIHCKNSESLAFAMRHNLHCFFHNTDDYTITSRGYIWAFPGKKRSSEKCIKVLPELSWWEMDHDWKIQYSGVCSDFVAELNKPKYKLSESPVLKPIDYDKHFVIGTPLVAWKCDAKEHMNWLADKAEICRKFPNVKWFASFELDNRGIEPFSEVIAALKEVNGDYWTYSINDMQKKVESGNRWIRIETGRNLIREFAQRNRITSGHHWGEDCTELNYGVANYSAVLYIDSDMSLDSIAIEKMLEVNRPLVGMDVPAYCLSGPIVNENPRIEEHWTTAGALLVNAPAFYDLPWSHNAYLNLSDDPTFQSMAERLLRREGTENLDSTYGMTWVRKDGEAKHHGRLEPLEKRKIADRDI
jgi:hypothetical protein